MKLNFNGIVSSMVTVPYQVHGHYSLEGVTQYRNIDRYSVRPAQERGQNSGELLSKTHWTSATHTSKANRQTSYLGSWLPRVPRVSSQSQTRTMSLCLLCPQCSVPPASHHRLLSPLGTRRRQLTWSFSEVTARASDLTGDGQWGSRPWLALLATFQSYDQCRSGLRETAAWLTS